MALDIHIDRSGGAQRLDEIAAALDDLREEMSRLELEAAQVIVAHVATVHAALEALDLSLPALLYLSTGERLVGFVTFGTLSGFVATGRDRRVPFTHGQVDRIIQQ